MVTQADVDDFNAILGRMHDRHKADALVKATVSEQRRRSVLYSRTTAPMPDTWWTTLLGLFGYDPRAKAIRYGR